MKTTKPNRSLPKKSKEKSAKESAQQVPNIKELLLGDGPRFDLVIPKRTKWRRRPTIIFD